jgi:hypothetical protein
MMPGINKGIGYVRSDKACSSGYENSQELLALNENEDGVTPPGAVLSA